MPESHAWKGALEAAFWERVSEKLRVKIANAEQKFASDKQSYCRKLRKAWNWMPSAGRCESWTYCAQFHRNMHSC